MPFTVGFGGEGEFTDPALEGAFTIVGPKMTDQSTLVRAWVRAQVALVRRKTLVGPDMTYKNQKRNQYILPSFRARGAEVIIRNACKEIDILCLKNLK